MDIKIMLLVGAIVVVFYFLAIYNRFITLKNQGKNAFSNIDVMLRKRYDLIPNLVNTVKGYMSHERAVLEEITALRNQLNKGGLSEDEVVDLNNQISKAVGTVFVAVEAYPDLKASSNFLHLQRAMAEIEEQLSASRRSFNMAATMYNTLLEKIPSNIVGKVFGFQRKCLFQATVEEKQMVDIQSALKSN